MFPFLRQRIEQLEDRRVPSIDLVSSSSAGVAGNGLSSAPAVSATGRHVAFESSASNLVPGDTNGIRDIFVKDTRTGAVTRVSTGIGAAPANGVSQNPSISATGRYVSFQSAASNLVPEDTNGRDDVFVWDRHTGTITRVSVAADGSQGDGRYPAISANGRHVAFMSTASNLVPGDTNGWEDVFVKDLRTGAVSRGSTGTDGTQGNAISFLPSISADGRFMAFGSDASNLVPGGTSNAPDVLVKDLRTGRLTQVNTTPDGTPANGPSEFSAISGDGRYVAFESYASNLVPGDTNGLQDVFVKDLRTGAVTRVSTGTAGTSANGLSFQPVISADGRFVAFTSAASNLTLGDTNGLQDVFVRDLLSGVLTRVSAATGGGPENGGSSRPALSATGRVVAFQSQASNLVPGDTNGQADVFLANSRGNHNHCWWLRPADHLPLSRRAAALLGYESADDTDPVGG